MVVVLLLLLMVRCCSGWGCAVAAGVLVLCWYCSGWCFEVFSTCRVVAGRAGGPTGLSARDNQRTRSGQRTTDSRDCPFCCSSSQLLWQTKQSLSEQLKSSQQSLSVAIHKSQLSEQQLESSASLSRSICLWRVMRRAADVKLSRRIRLWRRRTMHNNTKQLTVSQHQVRQRHILHALFRFQLVGGV